MRAAMLKQFDPVDYSVVVKLNRKPANSWRWEIHCAGKSTPVCNHQPISLLCRPLLRQGKRLSKSSWRSEPLAALYDTRISARPRECNGVPNPPPRYLRRWLSSKPRTPAAWVPSNSNNGPKAAQTTRSRRGSRSDIAPVPIAPLPSPLL
jgi:hypothetical protein